MAIPGLNPLGNTASQFTAPDPTHAAFRELQSVSTDQRTGPGRSGVGPATGRPEITAQRPSWPDPNARSQWRQPKDLPAPSRVTLRNAQAFAADPSKLKTFLDATPVGSRDMEVRRLLRAAVDDGPQGSVMAVALLQQLRSLGVDTTGYEASLRLFQQGMSDRSAYSKVLPPRAEREARRTVVPETRGIQAAEASITEVVPQNTSAMVEPGNRSIRQLVTKEVYDCVVVTYWDPVSKAGGLAHIPAGSNGDLSSLNEELKRQGLSAAKLQFSILGGVDYASAMAPDTGRFMPSAVRKIASIERQLSGMGVPKRAVALHTIHSRAEVTTGNRSNIGIDLRTGKTFFFSDPMRVLPDSPDRGYAELQDDTTDLYVVKPRG